MIVFQEHRGNENLFCLFPDLNFFLLSKLFKLKNKQQFIFLNFIVYLLIYGEFFSIIYFFKIRENLIENEILALFFITLQLLNIHQHPYWFNKKNNDDSDKTAIYRSLVSIIAFSIVFYLVFYPIFYEWYNLIYSF